jgi:hypothetical protein
MGVNPPDPTPYEGHDNDVAEARNLLLEFIGNCAPVTYRATILARRSPLALGLLVVACLTEVRDDDFPAVQRATMRGEAYRDPVVRREVAALLDLVDEGASPEAVTTAGGHVDNNTLPYRETVADRIARRDLLRVDWERLAADFTDEVTDWSRFTDEHDRRGCWVCLHSVCMVGYEDEEGDEEQDAPSGDTVPEAGESAPDPEAVERRYAHEHGNQESAPE